MCCTPVLGDEDSRGQRNYIIGKYLELATYLSSARWELVELITWNITYQTVLGKRSSTLDDLRCLLTDK